MKNAQNEIIQAARLQGEIWNGVRTPGEVATRQAAQLANTWRGFVELRNTLSFEDEPSSFDLALKRCKEDGPS